MQKEKTGRSVITPTGVEITFAEDELIVSKTNTKGIITYGNDVFLRLAGYTKHEIFGKPHNIIRHPEMPKCIFKLLWDTLKTGNEVFAYVNNMSKNGDHYWVLAHMTPTFNASKEITGYHSSRRVPKKESLDVIKNIYKKLLEEEKKHKSPKTGMEAAFAMLVGLLKEKGVRYDEFIFSI